MRIAISADTNQGLDSVISGHFGRCPFFILLDVEDGKVTSITGVDNPYFANHSPGMVPSFVRQQGADVMLAGGMGGRAFALFAEMGIEVASGAAGTVGQALERFLKGELRGFQPCAEGGRHDGHGGGCGHHD